MTFPLRICIFLVGFFFGGSFAGLATHWNSLFRLMGIFVVLRVAEYPAPRLLMLGRVGFFFGIFVEAFKVGS